MPDESRRIKPTPKPREIVRPSGKDIAEAKKELASLNPGRVTIGSYNDSFIFDTNDKVILAFDGTRKGLLKAVENYRMNSFMDDLLDDIDFAL